MVTYLKNGVGGCFFFYFSIAHRGPLKSFGRLLATVGKRNLLLQEEIVCRIMFRERLTSAETSSLTSCFCHH